MALTLFRRGSVLALTLPTMPEPFGADQVLLGKYRVERVLGRGGMGIVLQARHIALGEQVAIKVLDAGAVTPVLVSRFLREAKAAARLRSEHVAAVADVGQLPDGIPYMVMELLDGQDLAQLVTEAGPLGGPLAATLVIQACDALAEAHSLGIVHRDLKPSNLFVSAREDGTPFLKVLDFGIAKIDDELEVALTHTNAVMGTPGYMSPEQLRSTRTVDQRTDVWAMGIVLYELLEAERPFRAEKYSELCLQIAIEEPSPMVRMPAGIRDIVLRCLAKEPEDRYQSAVELATALAPFAGNAHAARIHLERMHRVARNVAARSTPRPARETEPTVRDAPPTRATVAEPKQVVGRLERVTADASPPPRAVPASIQIPSTRQSMPPRSTRRWWPLGASGLAIVGVVVVATRGGGEPPNQNPPSPMTPHPAPPVVVAPNIVPGAPAAPSAPSSRFAIEPGASLGCDVATFSDRYEVTYRLRETAGADLFVFDESSDYTSPPTRRTTPVHIAKDGDLVRVGQGVPPVLPAPSIDIRYIPRPARVKARSTTTRTLTIARPLIGARRLILDVPVLRSEDAGLDASRQLGKQLAYAAVLVDKPNLDVRRVSCEVALSAAGSKPMPKPPTASAPPFPIDPDASLACELETFPDHFAVRYRVTSPTELYVYDEASDYAATPARREDPIYLAWNERAAAVRVVQGIPPLPPVTHVNVRYIPETYKLAAGVTLTRTLRIARPLHEDGPTVGPNRVASSSVGTVTKLILDVHVIRPTVAGFKAFPSHLLKGAYFVRSKGYNDDVRRVTCELAIAATPVHLATTDVTRIE
ncbi:MAG: protein kinase [Deltaproteobacteria bacterium]|nr:protein kinase [Deltaproteobacteria bacterium]